MVCQLIGFWEGLEIVFVYICQFGIQFVVVGGDVVFDFFQFQFFFELKFQDFFIYVVEENDFYVYVFGRYFIEVEFEVSVEVFVDLQGVVIVVEGIGLCQFDVVLVLFYCMFLFCYLMCIGVVVGMEGMALLCQFVIEVFVVVVEYLFYGEIGGDFCDDLLDVVDLFFGNVVFILFVVGGQNIKFQDIVDGFGVQFILEVLIVVGVFQWQSLVCIWVVVFCLLVIEYVEVYYVVQSCFYIVCIGSFFWVGRGIELDVYILYQQFGYFYVVIFQEDYFVVEFWLFGYVNDVFDQFLFIVISWVGFIGKQEDDWLVIVVDDIVQLFQVGE